jgi:hypothetical protein
MKSVTGRSRVTNGSRFFLDTLDKRTTQARRFYDIAAQVAADLGGSDRLSETRISLIRRFAALSVLLEEQDTHIANGKEIDVSKYSHMSSTLVRLAQRIGLRRVPKNVTPDLHDYLLRHGNTDKDDDESA